MSLLESRILKVDPKKLTEEVTSVIIAHRKDQGLSHEKLAELAGVSRSTISRIESEQTNGTLFVFQKVANALGVSLSSILETAEKQVVDR